MPFTKFSTRWFSRGKDISNIYKNWETLEFREVFFQHYRMNPVYLYCLPDCPSLRRSTTFHGWKVELRRRLGLSGSLPEFGHVSRSPESRLKSSGINKTPQIILFKTFLVIPIQMHLSNEFFQLRKRPTQVIACMNIMLWAEYQAKSAGMLHWIPAR